ncbi:MAG TPA: hypothetical protein PLI18_14495 [Pirellulaceae bacterium]|nr:hypothetical protein [Pirellulaceae bacterium]
MSGKLLLAVASVALMFVAALPQSGQCAGGGGGGRVRLEARLSGQGTPASGKARFEARGSRMKLTVEVEDFITAPAQATVNVAGNVYVLNLSGAGFGDLNLDTENGQAVPDLSGGGSVVVTVGAEEIRGNF